jgi:hypothetical protein
VSADPRFGGLAAIGLSGAARGFDTARMDPFTQAPRPDWFEDLTGEVVLAFEVLGARTPGWADPHAGGQPRDEEYSRCLDPGKYGILQARVEAWEQVLTTRRIATIRDTPPTAEVWIGALRGADEWLRVQRLDSTVAGGLSLVVATTRVDGASFGFDLGIADDAGDPVYLYSVPDCGCDACDTGSADLLETLDGWILAVARGGVLHARGDDGQATRTIDGWQSQSRARESRTSHVVDVSWLDDSRPVPEEVRRWRGRPWL